MVKIHHANLEDQPYLRSSDDDPIAGAEGTIERSIILDLQQDERTVSAARGIVEAKATRLQEQDASTPEAFDS